MPIDPAAHRDAQRRYRERLSGLRAPDTTDIQRAISHAVRDACVQFVNSDQEGALAWIVRKAARSLADAGFAPQEVSSRLQRALQPTFITVIDGEFARVSDAEETADQDAETSAPAMGM